MNICVYGRRRATTRVGTGRAHEGDHLIRIFVDFFSAVIVAGMVIVMAVSFVAVVFTGPLAVFLERGIGTTLLGAAAMAATGAIFYSYKGTVSIPQDLTAVLLATAAASIAATNTGLTGDALFATIAVLLATTSAVTGIVLILLGKLRLSFVVRFIPYTVKGGFLAATGYLLLLGAIGTLLGKSISLGDVPEIFGRQQLLRWLPWIAIGGAILILTRRFRQGFVFPLCIAVVCVSFYPFLALVGISLSEAQSARLLLGPFGTGGFLDGVRPSLFLLADWTAVAQQSLSILAVAAMALLGGGLNLSGIELAVRRDFDTDQDFVAMGLSNLIAAPTAGLVGFPGIGVTILGFRLGLRGAIAGLMTTVICLGVAFFGAGLLELLPLGLFASVIAYLGIDLLYTWLWVERQRLTGRDFGIVFTILAVSALFGFLPALAFGLAISVLLFVISYAAQDFVRHKTDLSQRRSTVERELGDIDYLDQVGQSAMVFEFTGYLFFGTATRLKNLIETELQIADATLDTLILDFSRVQGLDPSAAQSLQSIGEACDLSGVHLITSGLSIATRQQIQRFNGSESQADRMDFATLDEAIEHIEQQLLRQRDSDGTADAQGTFLEALCRAVPEVNLDTLFPLVTISDGQSLLRHGEQSNEMYILKQGVVHVRVPAGGSTDSIVARLGAGALVGEIAFYGNAHRSADVIADKGATLYRVDRETLANIEAEHPQLIASFHNLAATYLARRLNRSTRLLGAVLG